MTTSETDPKNLGATQGSTSLVEILEDFRNAGYTHDFVARERGALVCGECNEEFDLSPKLVAREQRVEGASDPDDMQLALALSCPVCGARGTAVAHFGPMSDEISDDLVKALNP